jgi:hypothetical protein
MIRITGTPLPVRTRVPVIAWLVAGLLTLLSIVSSLQQFIASGGAAAMAEHAQHASATELFGFLRTF